MAYKYEMQEWNDYDKELSVEENINRGAVATSKAMRHIEEGIKQLSENGIEEVKIELIEDHDASSTDLTDGVLTLYIPRCNKGEKGDPGIDGANGKSNYEIAIDNGFEGTEEEWLESIKGEKGDKGDTGDQGEQGIQGEKGDPGETGLKGDPGTDGFDGHNIGVSTVEPEDHLVAQEYVESVSNIGDHFIAPSGEIYTILNTIEEYFECTGTGIVLVGGKDGEKGDQGEKGDTGEKGGQGEKGDTGEKGDPGKDGVNGRCIGISEGEPDNGLVLKNYLDSTYDTNDYFVAPSGKIYKIIGQEKVFYLTKKTTLDLSGSQGPIGPRGKQGLAGRSAYEVAVDKGFAGTEEEWLASLVGPRGERGPEGARGEKGDLLIGDMDIYRLINLTAIPSNTVQFRNSLYRGKDITELGVDEICKRVSDGTFEDLFIGDYFDIEIHNPYTLKTEKLRNVITAFDPFLNCGDTPLKAHHLGITTAWVLETTSKMYEDNNTTNVNSGGYINSKAHQVIANFASPLQEALNNHIIEYRDLLTTDVHCPTDNNPNGESVGWGWFDCNIRLMSEMQIFGSTIFSSSGFDTGIARIQLPLFRLNPESILGYDKRGIRRWYWLSSIANGSEFCQVSSHGTASSYHSYTEGGLRPFYLIG